MATNPSITAEIAGMYETDPRIPHPKEIALEERDHTVTLRGTVGTFGQRKAAVEIAKSVRGVHHVEDDLVVDLRDHYDDEQIRGAALQALIDADDVPADRIDVSVRAAWLTLKGEVKRQADSNAAFETVADLPGLGGITNKIEVVAPAGH